jgi:hypothetical protein
MVSGGARMSQPVVILGEGLGCGTAGPVGTLPEQGLLPVWTLSISLRGDLRKCLLDERAQWLPPRFQ